MARKTGEVYARDEDGTLILSESFVEADGSVSTSRTAVPEPAPTLANVPDPEPEPAPVGVLSRVAALFRRSP